MIKTIRKGAKVRIIGQSEEHFEIWGGVFEVYHKEGQFVRLVSLKKPYFGQCVTCSVEKIELI